MKKASNSQRIIIVIIAALITLAIIGVIVFSNSSRHQIKKQLEMGQKYLSELDYEQAVTAFTEAYRIEPNEETEKALVSAYLTWADSLLAENDSDKALSVLRDGYDICESQALSDKIKEIEDMKKTSEAVEKQDQEVQVAQEADSTEKFHAVYDAIIDATGYEILGTKFDEWSYDAFVSYIRANGTSTSTEMASTNTDYVLAEGTGSISEESALIWYNSESTYYQMQGNWHRIIYHHGDEISALFPILGMRIEDFFAKYGITMDEVKNVMARDNSQIYTNKWNISINYSEADDLYIVVVMDRNRVIQIESESGIIRQLMMENLDR